MYLLLINLETVCKEHLSLTIAASWLGGGLGDTSILYFVQIKGENVRDGVVDVE